MTTAIQVAGQPNPIPQKFYYTGKNIHATSGSRTANTTDLQVNDVLAIDPFGHDKGRGYDLANPTASYLSQPLYVVTSIGSDPSTGASAVRGGTIEAVPLSSAVCSAIQANTKANMTGGTTILGPVDMASASVNARHLVALTSIAAAENVCQLKAKAMETSDTSSTAAVKWVCPL
jgi:hypothetical protein